MTSPRSVISLGILFGIIGATGQLWLIRLGVQASGPLRGMLILSIAITIGVVAGARAKSDGVKVAALMGVVAGAILTLVGLGALLMNAGLSRQDPLASAESLLTFVSSVMGGTVIASWVIAGIAALIAWPISLSQDQ